MALVTATGIAAVLTRLEMAHTHQRIGITGVITSGHHDAIGDGIERCSIRRGNIYTTVKAIAVVFRVQGTGPEGATGGAYAGASTAGVYRCSRQGDKGEALGEAIYLSFFLTRISTETHYCVILT